MKNNTRKILFLLSILILFGFKSKKPAYCLYKEKGGKASYNKMIKKCAKADIVLFGEFHNNPISHWLQLEVTKDLLKKRELMLGAEMIEADNQEALNKYLSGTITRKGLDTTARLWKNFKTDYLPLVNLAKENKLKFIASNVPRRYASKVYRKGFAALDSLNIMEKTWMAPLPIKYDKNLPGYVAMIKMMGGHGGDNLPKAQALKDATMAHFIIKNREKNQLFIHYNGAFHSNNFDGIYWYLKQHNPDLKIVTITTVSQADIKKLEKEHKKKADFIIAVDEDMTETY